MPLKLNNIKIIYAVVNLSKYCKNNCLWNWISKR